MRGGSMRTFLRPKFVGQVRRYVKEWTPLSTTFNLSPNPVKYKPGQPARTGLFDIPELTSHEGFDELKERCISRTDELIREAVDDDRSRKMVEIFDELSDNLCKVADLAEFVRLAHPSRDYTQAAEGACAVVNGIVERLNTSRELYDALRRVVETGDKFRTDAVDDLVAKLFLFDFEQSGIHLPESDRNDVVSLNNSILQLGQRFVAGASAPTILGKKYLPEYLYSAFSIQGNQVSISGINVESSNVRAREFAYKAYLFPNPQQEELLNELLHCRHELAVTCGFRTYAERALRGSVMDTPQAATAFLDSLSKELRSRANDDFKIMSEMKRNDVPAAGELAAWDVPYYTQKYKRERFNLTASDYSPYFSLGTCMDGLNMLVGSLYGISLEIQPLKCGEVWCDDVYKLAVTHETEGLLGYIYCDFYERSGKPNQDCHFTIRGGKSLHDGDYQLPIVVLMLNLPTPRWSCPTLLTPGMVDNLFHEMGHALHSMMGRTHYQHITGTRCSTDLAEVPSVLMEYFAKDPRVVKKFARHFQTKEPIPDDMLRKLCGVKRVFDASEMQIQLFYSALDQKYHNGHPLDGTTTEVLAATQRDYYGIPYVENTAWQLRFSHLFGYGAKYYSYLVSTALASSIWHGYFDADPLCRSQGERFRRECLAHGGGKPPSELVGDFLRKEPTPGLLAEALITEIDKNRKTT